MKKKKQRKKIRHMDSHRSPKKEEQEEEIDHHHHHHQLSSTFQATNTLSQDQQHNNSTDEFDFFGITIDNNLSYPRELIWDFWEEEEEDVEEEEEKRPSTDQEGSSSYEFWDNLSTDYEDKKLDLKLNLNHQEVIDAWSDRRQKDTSMLMAPANTLYRGEVPVMDEERNTRREASVLRYKEKRQSRLFSKKIRYQVRKLNADKRPRFKGRFVKRET